MKGRCTNKVRAKVVSATVKKTQHPFVHAGIKLGTFEHARDMTHTNGIESFWKLMKPEYHATPHKILSKPLGHYFNEFSRWYGDRGFDATEQIGSIIRAIVGWCPRYAGLAADNVLYGEA